VAAGKKGFGAMWKEVFDCGELAWLVEVVEDKQQGICEGF